MRDDYHRALLIVSRDVYGKHYEDLTPKQFGRLREFIALAVWENEEAERLSKG